MKAIRSTSHLCIYCSERMAVTRDHVPPKSLLHEPLPKNLWTVPACRECNTHFSKDEEYFRLLMIGLFCHTEEAEELFNGSISSSLNRRPHLHDLLFNSIGVDGEKPFVTWDQNRICGVVKKIVQGLYFKEFGKPAPKRSLYNMNFVENEDPKLSPFFTASELRTQFAPGFSYRTILAPDQPTTYWQLIFYNKVHWLCALHDFEPDT